MCQVSVIHPCTKGKRSPYPVPRTSTFPQSEVSWETGLKAMLALSRLSSPANLVLHFCNEKHPWRTDIQHLPLKVETLYFCTGNSVFVYCFVQLPPPKHKQPSWSPTAPKSAAHPFHTGIRASFSYQLQVVLLIPCTGGPGLKEARILVMFKTRLQEMPVPIQLPIAPPSSLFPLQQHLPDNLEMILLFTPAQKIHFFFCFNFLLA